MYSFNNYSNLLNIFYKNTNNNYYYSYNYYNTDQSDTDFMVYSNNIKHNFNYVFSKLVNNIINNYLNIEIILFSLPLVLLLLLMFNTILIILRGKSIFYFKKINSFTNENMLLFKDSLILIFLYIVSILNLFYFSFKFILISSIGYNFILLNILLLLSITIQLPIIFLYNIGIFCILKLKGFLSKLNKFRVLVEDLFSLSTFIFRYFLQNIRWLLVSVSIYMVSENFFNSIKLDILFNFNQITVENNSSLSLTGLLLNILQLSIEYIDLIFMICVQLSAFCVLLFWLFSFIFSTTVFNFFELIPKKN